MKKKTISFISLAFIFLPCLLIFSACGKATETGFKVLLNGDASTEVELVYGEKIDLDVVSVYDDDTTKELSKSSFTLEDEDEIVGTIPSVGTYSLSVKYSDYEIKNITVVVKPKELSMPTIGASVQYSGNEQNCPLIGFDSELMNVSDNTAKVVGNYTTVVSLKDSTNYVWAGTKNNFELYYNWGIVKKRLNKPVSGVALEYNTNEQNYSIVGFDENIMTISGQTTGTIVDEYNVTISLKDTENYCWVDKSTDDVTVSWNIEKCKLVKPVAVEKVYTYNTEEQTFEMTGFDEETMSVSGNKQTNAGNSYKVEIELKDKANYCWVDETDDKVEFDFVIEKCKLAKPIAVDKVYVYNTEEQTFEMTGFDEETMSVSGNEQTNAGESYKVSIELKDKENYCWADETDEKVEFDFVIEKCKLVKPVAVEKVYVYNTEEQTFEMIGFNEETMSVSGNKNTIAGDSYTVVVVIDDKANYCWTNGTIEDVAFGWTIEKAQAIAPTVDALLGTYSPNQTLADFDLPEHFVWVDESIVPTVLTTKYLAKYNPNSVNYIDADVEIELNLEKCKLVKPEIAEHDYVYNTEEQTFEMTGFDAETMSVSNNVQTNAGEYTVLVSIIDKDNYCWTDETIADVEFIWTIAKIKLAKPIAVEKDYIYNTEEQTFEMTGFDEETMNVSNNVQTNAGEHAVEFVVKDFVNYAWVDDAESFNLTWLISKQGVEMLAAGDYEFVWTSEEIEFIPTDFDDQMFVIGNNKTSEVGVHNAVISIKDTINYEWSDKTEGGKTLAFEIKKATPLITFAQENIDKLYDGKIINVPRLNYSALYLSEWGASANFVDMAEDITLSYEIKDSDDYIAIESSNENFAKAGFYRVTMVMPETDHFNTVTLSKEFKIYNFINPDDYYLHIEEYENCYDGTAKEPEIKLYLHKEWEQELIDPSLYTVTYSNNVEVSDKAIVTVEFNDELTLGKIYTTFVIHPTDLVEDIICDGVSINADDFCIDNSIGEETVVEFIVDEKYIRTEGDKSYFDGKITLDSYTHRYNFVLTMNEEGRFICNLPRNISEISYQYEYKGLGVGTSHSLKLKNTNSNYITEISDAESKDRIFWDSSYNMIRVYDKSILNNINYIKVVCNYRYYCFDRSLNEDKTQLNLQLKSQYNEQEITTLTFDLIYWSEFESDYSNIKGVDVKGFTETEYKFVSNKVTINTLTSLDKVIVNLPGAGGGSKWTLSKGSTKIVNNQEMMDCSLVLPITSAGTYKLYLTCEELGSGTYTIVVKSYVQAFSIKVNDETYSLLANQNYSNKYGDFYLNKQIFNKEFDFVTFVGEIDSSKTTVQIPITSIYNCYNSNMEKITDLKKATLDIEKNQTDQRYSDLYVEIENQKYCIRMYFIDKTNNANYIFAIGDKKLLFEYNTDFGGLNQGMTYGDFRYVVFVEDGPNFYQKFVVTVSARELGEICSKDNNILGAVFDLADWTDKIEISPSWIYDCELGNSCGDFVLEDVEGGYKSITMDMGHVKLIINITND